MIKKIILIAAFLMATLSLVTQAEDTPEKPKKPWKSATELAAVSSNGNTKEQTAAGKETFTYNWTKTSLELIGGGYGARSKGVTTAEKYFASEKLAYTLSKRNYVFQKFAWDKDRFSGIRNRYDTNAGLGRQLIESGNNSLLGELGGGYIQEERIGDEDKDFVSGRMYGKYEYTLSPTSSFTQDAEFQNNFEDSDDFRIKTETAITAAINTSLSLKVSYVWKHVGVPPAGFKRNDTVTTVGLVATY